MKIDVSDATFDRVLTAPKAVVDFWSPTCPHCMNYKPVFEAVAGEMGDGILMAEAETSQSPASAALFNVRGIPATVFLVEGREVHRVEGEMTRPELVAAITRAFGAPSARTEAAPTGLLVAGGLLAGVVALVTYLLGRD